MLFHKKNLSRNSRDIKGVRLQFPGEEKALRRPKFVKVIFKSQKSKKLLMKNRKGQKP